MADERVRVRGGSVMGARLRALRLRLTTRDTTAGELRPGDRILYFTLEGDPYFGPPIVRTHGDQPRSGMVWVELEPGGSRRFDAKMPLRVKR